MDPKVYYGAYGGGDFLLPRSPNYFPLPGAKKSGFVATSFRPSNEDFDHDLGQSGKSFCLLDQKLPFDPRRETILKVFETANRYLFVATSSAVYGVGGQKGGITQG
jgi:hypothetical protein